MKHFKRLNRIINEVLQKHRIMQFERRLSMERSDMESVYMKFKDTVYRTAFSLCKDHTRAEDITSDVFFKCFTCQNIPEGDEHTKAWLIRVTINRCKDIFKSFRFKNVVSLDETQLIYETPEESDVYHAVMSLDAKYRIVIHLYYYEGYSTEEISKIIHKAAPTVRTRLKRAREMLKISLGKEFHT